MKTEKLEVRLTKQQKEVFQKVADEYGYTLTELIKRSFSVFVHDNELDRILLTQKEVYTIEE